MRPELPYSATIEITPSCNHACCYCYGLFGECLPSSDTVTSQTFSKVLAKLNEEEIMSYLLTGGEPFLRKDLLYLALENAKKNNVFVSINSNGTLIDDKDIEMLKEYAVSGILISLSSSDHDLHNLIVSSNNAASKTIEIIKRLLASNIHVAINMVVTQKNFNDVLKTGRYVKSLGVLSFSATPIQPTSPQHIPFMLSRSQITSVCDDLLILKKEGLRVDILEPLVYCIFDNPDKYSSFCKRSCNASINNIYINSNGDVRPCNLFSKQSAFGNIQNNSLRDLCIKMSRFQLHDSFEDTYIPKECQTCVEVKRCRGGCRVGAQACNGSLNSVHPYFVKPLTKAITLEKTEPIDFFKFPEKKLVDLLHFDISQIRIRKEARGTYLIVTPLSNYVVLSSSLYTLLCTLAYEKVITVSDLQDFSNKYNISSNALNIFLNKLVRR